MKIIIFGPPGSGKGTQTELLTKKYHIPRIVTGEILRAKAKSSKSLRDLLEAGDLVPDEMISEIVKTRLSKSDCQSGYILDGFPRTLAQAKYLESINVVPDMMIVLQVSDEIVKKRLGGRRVHESSGRVYNIHSHPPKHDGVDDITSEPLVIREDDKFSSIRHRLKVYHHTTELVVSYYENSQTQVVQLDGEQSAENLFLTIGEKIENP
jgi:adenylate kinase